jgi:hypothetical protein
MLFYFVVTNLLGRFARLCDLSVCLCTYLCVALPRVVTVGGIFSGAKHRVTPSTMDVVCICSSSAPKKSSERLLLVPKTSDS